MLVFLKSVTNEKDGCIDIYTSYAFHNHGCKKSHKKQEHGFRGNSDVKMPSYCSFCEFKSL